MGGDLIVKKQMQKWLHTQIPGRTNTCTKPSTRSRYNIGRTNEQPSLERISNLENIIKVSPKIIARAIENKENKKTKKENITKWKSQVSPAQKSVDDALSTIEKTPTLFLNADTNQVFNIMATEGHAQNGDATYQKPYLNTTRADIIEAITEKGTPLLKRKFSKGRFQDLTQKYTDNIIETIAGGLLKMEESRKKGKRLEKIPLRGLNKMTCFGEANPLELARGFFFAGNMDTYNGVRSNGFLKYGIQEGGGEGFLTQTKRIQELGIGISDMSKIDYKGDLEILNRLPNEKRLKVLENLKVIKRNNFPLEKIERAELTWEEIKSHPESHDTLKDTKYREQYIRGVKGYGVGDDIAIFLAGFLPPTIYKEGHKESPLAVQSRIIGGLLADKIDTISKESRIFIPGGADEIGAKYINGIWNKLAQNPDFREAYNIREQPDEQYNLLTLEELVDFTVAAANTRDQQVHSSQRYFWKDEEGTCAVTEYLKHAYFCAKAQNREIKLSDMRKLKIKPEKDIGQTKFTYKRMDAKKILSIMNERLQLINNSTQRETNLRQYYSLN